jgi:hypothetical protein
VIKYAAWLLSAAAAAATAAAGVAIDEDDLARCAGIAAPNERLACYDALELAHRRANNTAAAGAEKPAAAATPKPAAAPASAAALESAAAPTSPAAISAADPKNFGWSPAQQHIAFAGPASIKVHIEALRAANGKTLIVLDNGQTWTVAENDGWLSKGDEITIKRAALGSYVLKSTSNHTYYVRRVK